MDKKQIEDIKTLQNFLGGYTNAALEQIKLLPYLIFLDVKNHNIELGEEEIIVTLIPYAGKKGAVLRKRFKNKDAERAKILAKYILFWTPQNKKKPKVIIKWQTSK